MDGCPSLVNGVGGRHGLFSRRGWRIGFILLKWGGGSYGDEDTSPRGPDFISFKWITVSRTGGVSVSMVPGEELGRAGTREGVASLIILNEVGYSHPAIQTVVRLRSCYRRVVCFFVSA